MCAAENLTPTSTSNILFGAPEGQDARILIEKAKAAAKEDKILIHVAMDDSRLSTLKELISFFGPQCKVLTFPAWDCLPYDRVSPGGDLMAERMATLCGLLAWQNDKERHSRILLTTINATAQRVPPPDVLKHKHLRLKKGGTLNIKDFETYLSVNGYQRTDTVREHGEYAIRGGIIDLFPAGRKNPVRIDLFGDEIETIKIFSAETQITRKDIKALSLLPSKEYTLDEESISRFRQKYRETFGVKRETDPLYESITAGRRYNGMEHWLPLFFEQMATIFDYTESTPTLTFDQAVPNAFEERNKQIEDFYAARKTLEASQTQKKSKDVSLSGAVYHPLAPHNLYLNEEEWNTQTDHARILSPFPAKEGEEGAKRGRDFADIRALPDGDVFKELFSYILPYQSDRKCLIAAASVGARDRLSGLMENAGFKDLKMIDEIDQVKNLKTGQIGICILDLAHGFYCP